MKLKYFGLTETKLFNLPVIFKNRVWGGGSSEPPEPPLDPTLFAYDELIVGQFIIDL